MESDTEVVHTTPDDSETYNSSNVKRFVWRDRPENNSYEHGQLVVWFRKGDVSADDYPEKPQSAYAYDVPREAYEKMKRLAYSHNDSEPSVGEWFSNRFPKEYFTFGERQQDDLYEDKIEIN